MKYEVDDSETVAEGWQYRVGSNGIKVDIGSAPRIDLHGVAPHQIHDVIMKTLIRRGVHFDSLIINKPHIDSVPLSSQKYTEYWEKRQQASTSISNLPGTYFEGVLPKLTTKSDVPGCPSQQPTNDITNAAAASTTAPPEK